MENWWVYAIAIAAGYLTNRSLQGTKHEEASGLISFGVGVAVLIGVIAIGTQLQRDDCAIWREVAYDRADQIYNPMTMTEDEALGIAFASMESSEPTFC